MHHLFDHVGEPAKWLEVGMPNDLEFIDAQDDYLFNPIEWGVEDITTCSTPSRAPQVCDGPRLIPRIRAQDQAPDHNAALIGPPQERVVPSGSSTDSSLHRYARSSATSLLPRSSNPHRLPTRSTTAPDEPRSYTFSSPGSVFSSSEPFTPENHGVYGSSNLNPYFESLHARSSGYCSTSGTCLSAAIPTSTHPHDSVLRNHVSNGISATSLVDPMIFPSSRPRPISASRSFQGSNSGSSLTNSCHKQSPDNQSVKTTCLLQYLSAANPSPSLVDHIIEPGPARDAHFWFDVRNVRSWTAFNSNIMASVPELLMLLHGKIDVDALPTPQVVNTSPVTRDQLYVSHRDHFGSKLNTALKTSSAQSNIRMRNVQSRGHRMQPDFVSSYPSTQQQIASSYPAQRGRVIGIVLCYEQWSSGMRNGNPAQEVRYLSGLARLQHFLREHGCRYGFIITEIELVCIRYGGDDLIYESSKSESSAAFAATSSSSPIPIFGYLDVSDAVPLSRHTQDGRDIKMTAALALWYLHMQAGDQPLPGHHHWKLEIGGSSAMTRKKHLNRDPWMPKPVLREIRRAKRERGWMWPNEEFSKKERDGKRMLVGR